MKNPIRIAVITALLASASAVSQARGPNSYELLASVPDTTAAQQGEIHRIESERQGAYAALFQKQRIERDQIDSETAQKLRKTLGEAGYRTYAEWKSGHAGPGGRMHARGKRGHHPHPGMPGGPGMSGGGDLAPPIEDGDAGAGEPGV